MKFIVKIELTIHKELEKKNNKFHHLALLLTKVESFFEEQLYLCIYFVNFTMKKKLQTIKKINKKVRK